MSVSYEFHSLGGHLFQATIKNGALHLEMRDSIPQKPPNTVGLFVDGHAMPSAAQLLRRGQTRGAGTYDRHPLTGANFWQFRTNPAFQKSSFHDVLFDLLNRDGRLVDPQHARSFARRRTNSSG